MVKPVTPPSSTFDFSTMGFQYRDINGYMKYTWTEESGWNTGSFETDPLLKVHMCATGLNYGQQVKKNHHFLKNVDVFYSVLKA